jgi:hypothetical protein
MQGPPGVPGRDGRDADSDHCSDPTEREERAHFMRDLADNIQDLNETLYDHRQDRAADLTYYSSLVKGKIYG